MKLLAQAAGGTLSSMFNTTVDKEIPIREVIPFPNDAEFINTPFVAAKFDVDNRNGASHPSIFFCLFILVWRAPSSQ
jgi:hypothetical protein